MLLYKSIPLNKSRKPFLKCWCLLRKNLVVHKDEWCRGSDVVKENAGEQSEEELFSKSRVRWITTQSMRSDALDEELLSLMDRCGNTLTLPGGKKKVRSQGSLS
jgi:hypothetical protein